MRKRVRRQLKASFYILGFCAFVLLVHSAVYVERVSAEELKPFMPSFDPMPAPIRDLDSEQSLRPEDSVFSVGGGKEYHELIVEAFDRVYREDVRARAIVLPSFRSEYAVYVTENDGQYKIFRISPKLQLWGYMTLSKMKKGKSRILNERGEAVIDVEGIRRLEEKYPDDFRDVPILACDVDIDAELAASILGAWEAMLLDTAYRKSYGRGLDGTSYHFSMMKRPNRYAGQIWSPSPKSRTGKLVAVAGAMGVLCEVDNDMTRGALRQSLDDFSAALK